MTTVSTSEADALALELERRGMAVGTRGIYAEGYVGRIRLSVSGTPEQWQALLSSTLRPEQVAWLTKFAERLSTIAGHLDSIPDPNFEHQYGVPEGDQLNEAVQQLRQWLEQQKGAMGR